MRVRFFITKSQFLRCTLLVALAVSANLNAATTELENHKSDNRKVYIPVLENARIFAQFDDTTPAVINYFTSKTETAIIAFYNDNYGQASHSERKRGRLTLHYQQGSLQIRVVISPQDKLRQVDVIVNSS